MLKIKNNVDLKELEKYGFAKNNMEGYTYKIKDNVTNTQKKDIHINKYGYMAFEMYGAYFGFSIPDILYDLIKADLVEKVGEE